MGKQQSKQLPLFEWFRLPVGKEIVGFDPRYEDIMFSKEQSKLMISDIGNNIFIWGLSDKTNNFVLDSVEKIEFQREINIGRHFDPNGETLFWIDKDVICGYEINNKKLHNWDIKGWLAAKYNEKKTIYTCKANN